MANKSRSKREKDAYASYKATQKWKANRTRRLKNALKISPNNEQIKLALNDVSYRRKTPSKQVWSHSDKATAQLMKEFEGKFNMSELAKERVILTGKPNTSPERPKIDATPKGWFSIGARVKAREAGYNV